MTAYLFAKYDIHDHDAHMRYAVAADPILEKHGGAMLVADVGAMTIEGNGGMVGVVIQFPSKDAAMAFYQDPDYQDLKGVRLGSTTNATIMLATVHEDAA